MGNIMKRVIFLIIIFLTIFGMISAKEHTSEDSMKEVSLNDDDTWETPDQQHGRTKFVKVIDSDKFKIFIQSSIENIRLIGIDKLRNHSNNAATNDDTEPNETFTNPRTRTEDKYEIFRDLLLIIVPIIVLMITVMVTIFSFLAYRLIRRNIYDHVNKRVSRHLDDAYLRAVARSLLETGFMQWEEYSQEKETKKRNRLLYQAITTTKDAYERFALRLDETKRENELLINTLKNNLAYYYAELYHWDNTKNHERILALDYAKDVFEVKSRFPQQAREFVDTYNHVQEYCKK